MRISHKHKFVFLSVPKTGSSSIREALFPYSDILSNGDTKSPYFHHVSAKVLKNHFRKMGWNWDDYFKFAFVRDPWDKLVSSYNYALNMAGNTSNLIPDVFKIKCLEIEKLKGFEEYLEYIRNNMISNQYLNQYLKLYSDEGDLLIDFVGNFETIQDDFNHALDEIGLPRVALPHINKSKHKHFTECYSEQGRSLVAEMFKEDVDKFGYTFDNS